MMRKRKKRNDRNHIVYRLVNIHTGDMYYGISAVSRGKKATLKERFRRHVSKAMHEAKNWKLHKLLRKYPDIEDWETDILLVIRGRKNAHTMERSLINEDCPSLNTF